MKYAFRNFGLTFLISLIIFGAIAWVIVGALKDMSVEILTGEVAVGTQPSHDSSVDDLNTPTDKENEKEFKGNSFTFLAVALDNMPMTKKELEKWRNNPDNENKDEPFSSVEALMLVRVDKENEKFVFMSLPTDFVINFKGENMPLGNITKRVNIVEKGNINVLLNEVTSLTGLTIDYHAVIDMDNFVEAVDSIGGFSYNVPCDMKYEDPEKNLKINFKKGQKLTKASDFLKAMQFVTYNEIETENEVLTDFDLLRAKDEAKRNSVHIDFVNMVFEKMLTDDNMVSVAIWIPEIFKSTLTNFGLDAVKENIDLIFSYKDYKKESITYSENYVNYVTSKYSDSEPNKDNVKVAIARISAELNKAS